MDCAGQGELFEGLSIWEYEEYHRIQGTYPLISLSFANVKERDYDTACYRMRQLLMKQYEKASFLLDSEALSDTEKMYFKRMRLDMSEKDAPMALYNLSDFLYRYYGKKVIILLDEYDTPMQEAYVDGCWDDLAAFARGLFNSTFKTNPWLERAIMTGITRVSKESIFSDLNNLEVVTTTSDKYAAAFGFTEREVFAGLDECGRGDEKPRVKEWYDGFIFGSHKDIYNPWSILNFLDKGEYTAYWANTSSNSLVSKLLREGSRDVKETFEKLLNGETIRMPIDEQIVYNQLDGNAKAVWSLLLASGYLKVLSYEKQNERSERPMPEYELALTNLEVKRMFQNMVQDWFSQTDADYNDFIRAMLADDVEAMNEYMNRVAFSTFSYFDTGRNSYKEEPERFYHGFVLGLMVDLQDRYFITSNRESGFGRYDVILEPKKPEKDDAIILEFVTTQPCADIGPGCFPSLLERASGGLYPHRDDNPGFLTALMCGQEDARLSSDLFNSRRESSLEDTVEAARRQIEEKQYAAQLKARGIAPDHIRSYGFAFQGKKVLIG